MQSLWVVFMPNLGSYSSVTMKECKLSRHDYCPKDLTVHYSQSTIVKNNEYKIIMKEVGYSSQYILPPYIYFWSAVH
jgi:hypothetical protein